MKDFQAEKYQDFEQEIVPDKNSKPKGWGNWAGPGIKEKKIDP